MARMALVEEMMTMVWSRSRCVLFAMIGATASFWAQDAKIITYDEWSAVRSAKGGASAHWRGARRNRGTHLCLALAPLLAEVTLGILTGGKRGGAAAAVEPSCRLHRGAVRLVCRPCPPLVQKALRAGSIRHMLAGLALGYAARRPRSPGCWPPRQQSFPLIRQGALPDKLHCPTVRRSTRFSCTALAPIDRRCVGKAV